jgi:hypothetical protein
MLQCCNGTNLPQPPAAATELPPANTDDGGGASGPRARSSGAGLHGHEKRRHDEACICGGRVQAHVGNKARTGACWRRRVEWGVRTRAYVRAAANNAAERWRRTRTGRELKKVGAAMSFILQQTSLFQQYLAARMDTEFKFIDIKASITGQC